MIHTFREISSKRCKDERRIRFGLVDSSSLDLRRAEVLAFDFEDINGGLLMETAENVSPKPVSQRSKVGRTWADVLVGSTYVFGGILFISGILVGAWLFFGSIPQWILISIAASLGFIPFLMERARDGSRLFVVLDGPMRLTEYRVGHRVNLDLTGSPVQFTSKTGAMRSLLLELDTEERTGKGSMLAEFSQLDQIRDLQTVQRLSKALEETLAEDRLTMMHVGIEVEKKNREIVDWAMRLIMEGSVPTEITDALGIEGQSVPDMQMPDHEGELLDG